MTRYRAARLHLLAALLLPATAAGGPRNDLAASVAVDVAGDTNVYNGRGPDLVTRVSPSVFWKLTDERDLVQVNYDLGLWWYAEGKAKNSVNHHALLIAERKITRRLTLRVDDELVRAEDPGFVLRPGIVAPQTGILDNVAEASATYLLSRRLELGGAYLYRTTRFDPQPAGDPPLHDGDEQDGDLSLTLHASRLDDVRADNRVQYLSIDGHGLAWTEGPAIGWRRQLLRSLELRIDGGPLIYGSLDGSRLVPGSQITAITWRGTGVLRFYSRRAFAALSVLRDILSGTGAGEVDWAEYLTLRGGWKPVPWIDLRGVFGLFANGPAPSGARTYDGVTVDAIAEFRVAQWASVAGYYSFRWQEAHEVGPLPDLTRHVAGVRINFMYGAAIKPEKPEGH